MAWAMSTYLKSRMECENFSKLMEPKHICLSPSHGFKNVLTLKLEQAAVSLLRKLNFKSFMGNVKKP